MRKVQDAKIKDEKVLLRVDFNVPLDGVEIENDKRIRESIPTIQYLIDNGASKIIIVSHLGKPDGKKDDKYSLWPVASRLAELLSINIKFDKPQEEYKLSEQIILLENLRFNKGEEENEPEFVRSLANKASIYVNDAFGTCHRAHASTEGVAKLLPSYAGLLVQKEVEKLEALLKEIDHPFTFILGGAKIEDKLPVIKSFMTRADNFLIGGAIANTFLAARRHNMGKSLIEPNSFREANIIWTNLMDDSRRNVYLPNDLLLSLDNKKAEDKREVKISDLLNSDYKDYYSVDIGPQSIKTYCEVIKNSKTIFWNGGMGVSEIEEFANGTREIAQAIIDSGAKTVIGGGDTVAAFEKITNNQSLATNNLFLSTGGGATLEFLAGKELPGLKVLGYY